MAEPLAPAVSFLITIKMVDGSGAIVREIENVLNCTGKYTESCSGDDQSCGAEFVKSIPLGRLSTARDIAEAALYLCSERASLVTGLCMEVDGGRCI